VGETCSDVRIPPEFTDDAVDLFHLHAVKFHDRTIQCLSILRQIIRSSSHSLHQHPFQKDRGRNFDFNMLATILFMRIFELCLQLLIVLLQLQIHLLYLTTHRRLLPVNNSSEGRTTSAVHLLFALRNFSACS